LARFLKRKNAVSKTTKGQPIGERFSPLVWSVIDSAEFVDLSDVATRILIKLLRLHNGHNNGNIALGSREAARWAHCGQRTACRALSELVNALLLWWLITPVWRFPGGSLAALP